MAGSTLKHQLKVITIPVFIEIALVMLLGAVDTVMLSRYSDNSVAAVGLGVRPSSVPSILGQDCASDWCRWWAWRWW